MSKNRDMSLHFCAVNGLCFFIVTDEYRTAIFFLTLRMSNAFVSMCGTLRKKSAAFLLFICLSASQTASSSDVGPVRSDLLPSSAFRTESSSYAQHLSPGNGDSSRNVRPPVDGSVVLDSIPSWPSENSAATLPEAVGWTSSRPCCVSVSQSRHDCFFRVQQSTIGHLTKLKGQKDTWENLGGQVMSDIGCTSWGPSHILVYYLSSNQTVLAKSFETDKWSEWEALPMSALQDTPQCLPAKPGMIDCIGRTAEGTPAVACLRSGAWKRKKIPIQHLSSSIECLHASLSSIDCFATGIDNEMKHLRRTYRKGWASSWKSLGGACKGSPSPILTKTQRLEVFVTSSMDRLAYISRYNGVWTHWKLFDLWGPPLTTEATCVASIDERIDCFAAFQPSGQLHRVVWNGDRWSKWKVYAYNIVDKPLCHFAEDQRIWCLLFTSAMKWKVTVFNLIDLPALSPLPT